MIISDLGNAAKTCFIISTILLITITILFYDNIGISIVGFILGGIAGVIIPFYKPGRPLRIGRGNKPKNYTEYERKLESAIVRHRSKKYMIAVTIPYFLLMGWYILAENKLVLANDISSHIAATVISNICIGFLVAGVQYYTALRSIARI